MRAYARESIGESLAHKYAYVGVRLRYSRSFILVRVLYDSVSVRLHYGQP